MGKLKEAVIKESASGALAIASTIAIPPAFIACFFLLKASYAILAEIKPDEATSIYAELEKRVRNLEKVLPKDKDLQTALAKTFEAITQARHDDKIAIIKSVFFNEYIPPETREEADIERYYNVINAISIPALEHLYLLKREILPIWGREVMQEARSRHSSSGDKDIYGLRFHYRLVKRQKMLSDIISKWTSDNYGTGSLQARKIEQEKFQGARDTKEFKLWGKKNTDELYATQGKFNENAAELTSLGIFISHGGSYHITDFGERFSKLIPAFIPER